MIYQFGNYLSLYLFTSAGIVNAATTPITIRVINVSAKVNAFFFIPYTFVKKYNIVHNADYRTFGE